MAHSYLSDFAGPEPEVKKKPKAKVAGFADQN